MSGVVGWAVHAEGERRLVASYDALPLGAPVRLAKATSNLFRARSASDHPGLDASGLRDVIAIDASTRTADVQAMCTYEDLVAVTLPHGLIPLVVPQLRTITLGGAVTGLGIEATSFRNGLPHESVLEMDVLTGRGEILNTRPGDDLFRTFPNSYGSLGYATRIRIELEQVPTHVGLRHVRFDDLDALAKNIDVIVTDAAWEGLGVDAVDGVVFGPDEAYLTLATFTDHGGHPDERATSDYAGKAIYYRSIQERETDLLSMNDYLWRWDTDWFWCSRAFGAQHPLLRRVWPRRWRRSDIYHRLVDIDNRLGIKARIEARQGKPPTERVVQDIEIPVDRLSEFLRWYDDNVAMRPVWLCPLRLRETGSPDATSAWPSYPLEPELTYVNVGFWGTVATRVGAREGEVNRQIENKVSELGGHKSLYSDAYYDQETFDQLYGGANLAKVKQRYDPDDRLTGLYEKAVRRR